jgi:hypothetical protein
MRGRGSSFEWTGRLVTEPNDFKALMTSQPVDSDEDTRRAARRGRGSEIERGTT